MKNVGIIVGINVGINKKMKGGNIFNECYRIKKYYKNKGDRWI